MPHMTRLPADLARFGLRVETVPGWETRGSASFAPAGVVCHWTAGPANSHSRPSLNVVVNGRPGLDGPLCNVYLARDGVCVVVAAGRANHAGTGSWRGLVGNSAVYGIEAESAGPNDWTQAQRDTYPRLVAAMLSGLGRGPEWACGHSEWAGPRKTDINGYTTNELRAEVGALLANPTHAATGEPDLDAFEHETLMEIAKRVQGISFATPGTPNVDSPYVPLDSLRLVGLTDRQIPALVAEVAGLRAAQQQLVEAISKLAQGDDVDVDALVARIGERVDAAVADAAKLVRVQVSVDDTATA